MSRRRRRGAGRGGLWDGAFVAVRLRRRRSERAKRVSFSPRPALSERPAQHVGRRRRQPSSSCRDASALPGRARASEQSRAGRVGRLELTTPELQRGKVSATVGRRHDPRQAGVGGRSLMTSEAAPSLQEEGALLCHRLASSDNAWLEELARPRRNGLKRTEGVRAGAAGRPAPAGCCCLRQLIPAMILCVPKGRPGWLCAVTPRLPCYDRCWPSSS